MKVTVTFDLDKRFEEEEKKAENAQQLLDSIIYDYQIGMVCTNSVIVDSPKFYTKILPREK